MKNEEAIRILEGDIHCDVPKSAVLANKHNEAVLKAIEALEKQIPKKIVLRTVNRGFNLPMPLQVEVCPCCGIDTPNPRNLERYDFFCPDCGQMLDWSREE